MSIRFQPGTCGWASVHRRTSREELPNRLVSATVDAALRIAVEQLSSARVLSERVAWLVEDSLLAPEPAGEC